MLTADADYQRVVSLLSKQQLAPYVSYVRTDKFNGVVKHRDPNRVVVRVSDGKIIAGDASGVEVDDYKSRSNPVSHPTFDPKCYRATSEHASNYNGADAIQIDLERTCKSNSSDDDEYPFRTLYASASTMQILDVSGKFVPSDDDGKHVTVNIDEAYNTFEGRVLPERVKVDVTGNGWMFWLQVHVTETYSDYAFTQNP